jgi:hypothetical protein
MVSSDRVDLEWLITGRLMGLLKTVRAADRSVTINRAPLA